MAKSFYQYETFGEKSRFFFNGFKYIDYDILGNGQKVKIKNFFKRFDFNSPVS